MTTVTRSATVPYTPAQMYDLVNDVERYPEFLPWCRNARILEARGDEIRATLELAKGGIRKSFTTLNRGQRNKMIEIRLVSGPFQHLEGFWRFDPVDGGTRIRMDMDFEFANPMLRFALGPVFHQIVNTLVDSFVSRAREIYGRA